MVRLIALDTETTGMNKRERTMAELCRGHRIIEIACVEIVDGELTGKQFHRYLNPKCKVDPKATKIHGIDDKFLKGKPVFKDIVDDLLEFIGDSQILIHNASFDTAFLDKEFGLLRKGKQPTRTFKIIDTLQMARELFPGSINTLEGLCHRYGIPGRSEHGALIDAIILAKVYLEMKQDVLYERHG